MRLRLYLRSAVDFVGRSDYRGLLAQARRAVYSDTVGVIVRKDLTGDPAALEKARPPTIRAASLADVQTLLAADHEADMDAEELWERRLRRYIVQAIGVEGCLVADAEDKGPAFMQYLFTAKDNDRLQAEFPGLFPVLAANEALVEFLYVAPDARSPGLAVNCLLNVAAAGQRMGATSVVSYIDPTNKGALFVNHLAGFEASGVRRGKRRLLRTSYSFEAWPAGASTSLSDVAGGKVTVS